LVAGSSRFFGHYPSRIVKSQQTMKTDLRKKAALGGCFTLVALICAGCNPATGTISGTVTYKNQPLPGGSVTFVTDNGTATGTISNDGKYTADNVPVGNAKVTVFYSSGPKMYKGGGVAKAPKDGSPEAQKMFENMKKGVGAGVSIPSKYNDLESSGLSVTVTTGQNPPFNIELKD
jgi:hypothetical protein